MTVYTVQERIEMVEWMVQGLSLREAAMKFKLTYPNRTKPTTLSLQKLYRKFKETGCLLEEHKISNKPKRGMSEEKKTMICTAALQNPDSSIRKIAKELNIPKSSVHKLLKTDKFKSFKRRWNINLQKAANSQTSDSQLPQCNTTAKDESSIPKCITLVQDDPISKSNTNVQDDPIAKCNSIVKDELMLTDEATDPLAQ